MLYLEDYLEMIEHLPQELRDRFTEMREMELNVQNNMDSLDRRSKTFFSECKRGELKDKDAEDEFQGIRKDYYKVLEEADEKVALSTQMHELVERYLRRLDNELFKFKCELEADNNGITEILEKRSLELDGSGSMMHQSTQKENRYFGSIGNNHHASGSGSLGVQQKEHRYRHRAEKRRDSGSNSLILDKRSNIASGSQPSTPITPNYIPSTPTTPSIVRATAPSVTHNQTNLGTNSIAAPVFNSNIAIAAAASQAIVATQQMQQGRRTASLKASYEATMGGSGNGPHEIIIGRELAGATHNAIQAVENHQRKKKKVPSIPANQHPSTSAAAIQQPTPIQTATLAIPQVVTNPHIEVVNTRIENGLVIEQTADGEEWSYDPNEPRYCICNQVSYGDMVACDNDTCPLEWFHYSCVGITQPPKGKWYCPKCTQSMKRRNRKN